MNWKDRDTYMNPVKSITCVLGIAAIAALVLIGIAGAIWAVVEAVRVVL